MNITIARAGPVEYAARLDGRLLCTSRTPFFAAARVLEAEGVPGSTVLTMTYEGSDMVCLRATLASAARSTVTENRSSGPYLARFREMPTEMAVPAVRVVPGTASSDAGHVPPPRALTAVLEATCSGS